MHRSMTARRRFPASRPATIAPPVREDHRGRGAVFVAEALEGRTLFSTAAALLSAQARSAMAAAPRTPPVPPPEDAPAAPTPTAPSDPPPVGPTLGPSRPSYVPSQKPVPRRIVVAPATISLAAGTSFRFAAQVFDQNNRVMDGPPPLTWTVRAGGAGGTVDAAGVFTAPSGATGTTVVT